MVETPDGIVHAVIGDVCGHGAAEAAIGVCLRVAWRSLVLAGAAPAALMELLEQLLMAEREDDHLFATLTHLVFGPDQRSVRVLRAGHPGLLLRTPGHVDLVEGPAGPALGLVSDGRQIPEKIKSDPELSHVPVVILTTSSSEEDILRSYKLHADAYVTKPVDVEQFIAAVRQIDEFFVSVVKLPRR